MNRSGALLVAALMAGLSGPAGARELWRSGETALSFSGSLREIATFTRGTDADDFAEASAAGGTTCLLARSFPECPGFTVRGERDVWQSLTRLRLRLDLEIRGGLTAVAVWDNEVLAGILDTFDRTTLRGEERDTFLGLEEELHGGSHVEWHTSLYRGYLRYEGRHVEATLGRQRIPWGVGRLWNPIDRFNAVPPLAIEGDQSPGVDAAEARWVVSGFSYLQAVYAPGTRSDEARYALRWAGVLRDVDYSLMAGVFEEALTLGFDLAANLADGAVRLEVVYTDPDLDVWEIGDPHPSELDRFWQIVASWDTNLPVGKGIYLLVEHLYNGNDLGFGEGEAGNLLPLFESTLRPPDGLSPAEARALGGPLVETVSDARFGGSRVVTRSSQLTGLQLGYDLLPVLRLDVLGIWDWDGSSAALFPSLAYTGWNDLELRLGLQLFAGGDESEFGASEHLVFVQAEWFF